MIIFLLIGNSTPFSNMDYFSVNAADREGKSNIT